MQSSPYVRYPILNMFRYFLSFDFILLFWLGKPERSWWLRKKTPCSSRVGCHITIEKFSHPSLLFLFFSVSYVRNWSVAFSCNFSGVWSWVLKLFQGKDFRTHLGGMKILPFLLAMDLQDKDHAWPRWLRLFLLS